MISNELAKNLMKPAIRDVGIIVESKKGEGSTFYFDIFNHNKKYDSSLTISMNEFLNEGEKLASKVKVSVPKLDGFKSLYNKKRKKSIKLAVRSVY